jgi:hypothetical protein
MNDPLPSVATVRPELPRCIIELVDRALAFEKTQRWPGARAMQDALILAREGISSTPEVDPAGPDSASSGDAWGRTEQAIPPFVPERTLALAGPPPQMHEVPLAQAAPMPPQMNPLFTGNDGSVPPVARPAQASYYPPRAPMRHGPPRGPLSIATILVVAILVFGAFATAALLLVDRSLLPGAQAAAPPKVATLPATPPHVEDPIPPPPPVADPAPVPDPVPLPPPATAAAPAPPTAPPVPTPVATTPSISTGSPATTPVSSPAAKPARSPRRPVPSSDPIVRTNPFDK